MIHARAGTFDEGRDVVVGITSDENEEIGNPIRDVESENICEKAECSGGVPYVQIDMAELRGLGGVRVFRVDPFPHVRADLNPVAIGVAEPDAVGTPRPIPFGGSGQNARPRVLEHLGGRIHV